MPDPSITPLTPAIIKGRGLDRPDVQQLRESRRLSAGRQDVTRGMVDVEELRRFRKRQTQVERLRSGGLAARIMGRLTGTDIEDPLQLPRMGTIAAGAVAGAIGGSRIPPGPPFGPLNPAAGAIALGTAGAIAGAVAPEATIEALEAFGMLPEGTRLEVGLNNEELRYIAETEGLLDLVLGTTFQAASLARRPVSRMFAGVGQEGRELAEGAAKEGIELPALALGKSRPAKFFVSVFGRFPFISPSIRRQGVKAERQLKTAIAQLPQRFAPIFSETDLGVQIYRNARTVVKAVSRHFDRAYKKVFSDANAANVAVLPRGTLAKADEILAKIVSETPVQVSFVKGKPKTVRGKPGIALQAVESFIKDEILTLRAVAEGGSVTAKQTLRQMDGLISKIDQKIASMEPGQQRFARALLGQLSSAAKKDVLENLSGEGAGQIGKALRNLDKEFSNTMRTLFETSTAKRFASVRRRGLRGVTFDEATRTPIDQLARIIVDLSSPQAVEELSRIVSKRTFRRIAAKTLDDAMDSGFRITPEGDRIFNPSKVITEMGLDRAASGRRQAYDKLIRKASDGQVGVDVADTILRAAQTLERAEIPDVALFIARRGMISGLRGILRGMFLGAFVTGAGGAAGGMPGGVIGASLFFFGGRGMSKLLADPNAARALSVVANKTASIANRKVNTIRIMRGLIVGAASEDIIPVEWIDPIMKSVKQWVADLKLRP